MDGGGMHRCSHAHTPAADGRYNAGLFSYSGRRVHASDFFLATA
jgi:hypothetical protein